MSAPQTPERATGAELIAAERRRQIDAEGWTAEHDDRHVDGEMAWAAACYAAPDTIYRSRQAGGEIAFRYPWPGQLVLNAERGRAEWVPWRRGQGDRVRDLVRAGALIAAEIDRLERERAAARASALDPEGASR